MWQKNKNKLYFYYVMYKLLLIYFIYYRIFTTYNRSEGQILNYIQIFTQSQSEPIRTIHIWKLIIHRLEQEQIFFNENVLW